MSAEGVIDLDRELQGIFKKEEMRAFFDFRITLENGGTAQGLCKISEPKKHASGSTYFSLLFLIDVPDQSTWAGIDAVMARIRWNQLQKYLAHVESVMSVPIHKPLKQIYIRETYVYVAPPRIPDNEYLISLLHPAIARVTGFQAGELVIWDDEISGGVGSGGQKDAAGKAADHKSYPPFLEKLKRLLQS